MSQRVYDQVCMTDEHLIKIDPTKLMIRFGMERKSDKSLYVKMTIDMPFEDFKDIANNPYLNTGYNEVKKCSTNDCKGWFATVDGKPTGEQCYEDCGNYYCENCVDKYMKDYAYSKVCKKCK